MQQTYPRQLNTKEQDLLLNYGYPPDLGAYQIYLSKTEKNMDKEFLMIDGDFIFFMNQPIKHNPNKKRKRETTSSPANTDNLAIEIGKLSVKIDLLMTLLQK